MSALCDSEDARAQLDGFRGSASMSLPAGPPSRPRENNSEAQGVAVSGPFGGPAGVQAGLFFKLIAATAVKKLTDLLFLGSHVGQF